MLPKELERGRIFVANIINEFNSFLMGKRVPGPTQKGVQNKIDVKPYGIALLT